MIEPDRPTIASMLRDHGYATAMYGKWHNAVFSQNCGIETCMTASVP